MGDVLPLNTPVDGDVEVMVGALHKFNGKPGVRNNKSSVKITEIIREEGE